MKKVLFLCSLLVSLFSQAQNVNLVATPGQRVMSDPLTGALATLPEIVHGAVDAATTTFLPANTYNNGTAGIGATLTENANGALPAIDGVTLVATNRILVMNEVTQSNNGIYVVTQVGDGSHPYILTRANYSAIGNNLAAGSNTFVKTGGTVNGTQVFYQTTNGTITVGTTNLVYSLAAGLGGAYLKIVNNLYEIAAAGPTAQANAQANLGVFPLSPLTSASSDTTLNSSFVVIAAGIPRTSNSYVQGDTILWTLVSGVGSHAVLFLDSAGSQVSDGRLRVYFPPVKNVNTMIMTPDETIGPASAMGVGASVGLFYGDFQAWQPVLVGYSMVGNGTTTLTNEGTFADYTASAFTVSSGVNGVGITFTGSVGPRDALHTPVQYQGPNGYTIENVTTGLGSYNKIFRVLTPSGGYLVTNPTANDHFVMGATTVEYPTVNLAQYTATNGYLSSSFANFWVIGVFECYIVGNAISPTSAQVRFQVKLPSSDPYYGATSFKIYRDVSRYFTSPTLVHTGADGSFVDTGLTPNVVYYYQYVPTIGGTPMGVLPVGNQSYPWYPIVTNH